MKEYRAEQIVNLLGYDCKFKVKDSGVNISVSVKCEILIGDISGLYTHRYVKANIDQNVYIGQIRDDNIYEIMIYNIKPKANRK